MYDCHLQMVVISVPASGVPMLTLYGELPCFVAHLIYSLLIQSFMDVNKASFLETRQLRLLRKAHEVCWNVAFYILNTIYRFDLHVHWQKAITKEEKKWLCRATSVMTCLTNSCSDGDCGQCVCARVCVWWEASGFVHSSPLFIDIKVHFPCVQNKMWMKNKNN